MPCPPCNEKKHESCVMATGLACAACGHYHPGVVADATQRLLCGLVRRGRADEVRRVLQGGLEPTWDRRRNEHPLLLAAAAGDAAIARLLLEAGADVRARSSAGETALHLAAGCLPVVQLLLLHHADVTARDGAGRTAEDLMLAAGRRDCADAVAASLKGKWIAFRRMRRTVVACVLGFRDEPRQHYVKELVGGKRRWARLVPAPATRPRSTVYWLVPTPTPEQMEAAEFRAEPAPVSAVGRLRAASVEKLRQLSPSPAPFRESVGARTAREARERQDEQLRRRAAAAAARADEVDWMGRLAAVQSRAKAEEAEKEKAQQGRTVVVAAAAGGLGGAALLHGGGPESDLAMGAASTVAAGAAALFGAGLAGLGVPAVVELLFVMRLLLAAAESLDRAQTKARFVAQRVQALRAPLETVARQLAEHSHVAQRQTPTLDALVAELRGVHAAVEGMRRKSRLQLVVGAGHLRRELDERLERIDSLVGDLQLRLQAEILGEVAALRRENAEMRSEKSVQRQLSREGCRILFRALSAEPEVRKARSL